MRLRGYQEGVGAEDLDSVVGGIARASGRGW